MDSVSQRQACHVIANTEELPTIPVELSTKDWKTGLQWEFHGFYMFLFRLFKQLQASKISDMGISWDFFSSWLIMGISPVISMDFQEPTGAIGWFMLVHQSEMLSSSKISRNYLNVAWRLAIRCS